jgi:molecular chaperone DnaJ
VAPSASPEDLRAAYRALARRLHPDAPGGSSAAMAEVNEAWRVLSDPGRRAVYDASLRPQAPSSGTVTGPTRASDGVRGDIPLDMLRRGRPAVRGTGWMVFLGVLLAIFLFSAYANGQRGSNEPGVDGLLQIGSCVALPPLRNAQEVPCSGPHDGVVVTVELLGGPCPGRLRSSLTPDGTQTVCIRNP